MQASKLTSWLQIVSNAAVLVGLLLVGVQLNQTYVLNRAEHGAKWSEESMEFAAAAMGENFAAVLARSAVDPGSLTPEDLVIIHYAMEYKWSQMSRGNYLVNQGVLREDIFLLAARSEGRRVFAQTPIAVAWWQDRIDAIPPGQLDAWQKVVSEEVQKTRPDALANELRGLAQKTAQVPVQGNSPESGGGD